MFRTIELIQTINPTPHVAKDVISDPMYHPDGTMCARAEQDATPPELLSFLLSLEHATTSEAVWNEMVAFNARLGLTCVDYIYATDFKNWERAQFIRTTFNSEWFEYLKQFPHIRHTSCFRMHAVKYVTPLKYGIAYVDDMGPMSADRRRHLRLSASMGMAAAIAIPLRMGDPGQAGMLGVGGPLTREEFDKIWDEHGWSIHAGMLSAHTRYTELFKAEFVQRNQLTEKHQELIRLVGEGKMDKQIAHELGISHSAVRQRLQTVQERIGVRNRADLAAVAAHLGLVPDPLLKHHDDALTVFLCTGDGKTGEESAPGATPAKDA